jgi:hypothetical protein
LEEDTQLHSDEEVSVDPFEQEMLDRVKSDFKEAEQFLKPLHAQCVEAFEAYHNAGTYEDLKRKNRFPMPVVQTLVDKFVSHTIDKMFYANKPCTVIGVEESDKQDAEAKQEMIAWQDRKDKMSVKLEKFLRDAALYPFCAAQVDYTERSKKQWQEVEVPREVNSSPLGQAMGQTSSVVMVKEWARVPVVTYRGPEVKRLDPTTVFFGPDKRDDSPEFPIMVKTKQTRAFFDSRDYFYNQDKIEEIVDAPVAEGEDTQKRDLLGLQPSAAVSKRGHEYIEWQGLVDATKFFTYLGDDNALAQIEDGEEVFILCGVADGKVVVRMDEDPLELDGSNIIVGWMLPEEDEFIGGSMTQKVMAVHKGSQSVMGMLLENLKQHVNAMWIINKNTLVNKKPLVNKAGHTLLTNDDVNKCAKRVEQPGVAKDLYIVLQMLKQLGQDTTDLQNTMLGQGEEQAETLGENTIIASQAELGLRRALRCFEVTFVEPLYEVRNEINCNFLDQEYVYYVIGDGVVNWRAISPEQVRARVDFICESSTRETNKAVIGQQLLQLLELAPTAQAMGQPVRADLMMKKWLETMGSMKESESLMFFPLIQMEKLQGIDANMMMVQMAMQQQQANIMGAMPPPAGPDGQRPEPTSEGDAIDSANARNQTQVGAM